MGADRQAGGGRGAEERLGSVWGPHVPDHVIKLLLDRPGGTPIAGGEPSDAVVLVADVAGFTPMSEALAGSGHYGTEELSGILNGWFDAMNGTITQFGGSLAEYAGDALIAVFRCSARTRRSAVRRAAQCALDMQADMIRFQPVVTRAGSFRLTMKIGIAAGPLLQTVMGDPAVRLGSVLLGSTLQRAVTAEHGARGDEIVADDGLLESILDEVVVGDDHRRLLTGLRTRTPRTRQAASPTLDGHLAGRLEPFLHPVIAERLRSGHRELVNEHRTVTALFVELPAVPVDDRRAVEDLQRHLAAAVGLIARYGGHFRHLAVGDGGSVLVAFFGAPVSHEDDEERSVLCGLELLRLPGGPYRAGVATGAVYCGEVGTDTRREYAVIGDSVNLAARLMQAAGTGQLLIDRGTYDQVSDHTVRDRLAPIAVKGKAGRIEVWAVRAPREGPGTHTRGPTDGPPLVGREAEVARGRALVERVLSGRGQVVATTGDAGVGKSRLTAEVVGWARRHGFAVFGGAARSHGTNTSYLVWRSIWRDLLGLDTSLPIADQQARLVDRIAQHVPDAAQRAPLLALVVNLPMSDSALIAPLDPQTRDGLLRGLLRECLRSLAGSTPILVVLEDCHWIDPASAALVESLAPGIGDRPVLILATGREPFADAPLLAPLTRLSLFSEVRLTELSRPAAERLVTMRLRERYPAGGDVDPTVVHRIAEQGQGNPFHLEELVDYLRSAEVDPRDAQALATLELPDGLQRLLMARLDQLGEGERAIIKVASVIGRRFRARWISDAYPAVGGPEEVEQHLERLHELGLTPRRTGAPEPEYQFKHAMTQEAAYQSLTYRMRESLHERVGTLVEEANPGRLGQYVDVLAHHYGRTQRVDKQRVWFRSAGDAAKAAFSNEAAISHYRRLLPLLPAGETGDVLVELGGVWQLTGEWAEAERAYRRAMEVASAAGRPEVLAAGQRDLGDLFMYNRSHAEAVMWLRMAADGFEHLGNRVGLSRTLDRLTFALYRHGAYDDALAIAGRHRALATEDGDLAGLSIALNHTGLVHLETGRPEEARALLEQALDTATRVGDRQCLLHAANNLAVAHLRQGDHRPAIAQCLRAFEVAQEIGWRQTAGVVVGNLGEIYRDEGAYAEASRCFAYALRIALELRDWTSIAYRVADMGATADAQGRRQDAERLLGRAITIARSLEVPNLLCVMLHRLAKVHLAQGRYEAAARLNHEALDIAEAHDEHDVIIRAAVLGLHLRVALGHAGPGEAIAALRELEDVFTEPHERALLLDAHWHLDPTAETVRVAAVDLYRHLYERTPIVEYREAHDSLTRSILSAGPPLPPLPESLGDEDLDTEELFQRIDDIAPHLTGTATVGSDPLDLVGTREAV